MTVKKLHTHLVYALLLIITAAAGTACLRNDIPYARIQANILEIAAAGQSSAARVDSLTRTVNFYFPEEVDISRVEIDSVKLAPGVSVVDDAFSHLLDLSRPVEVTLRLYQDYIWTLKADQTIERYFAVAGQIGTTTIDIPARRVAVFVNEHADRSSLRVEKCKLGPKGWAQTPELTGQTVDFTHPVEVTVDYYGTPQVWTIYVELTESSVTTVRVDAGTNVAWAYGEGEAGADAGFEYRIAGDDLWTRVPEEWVTVNGGAFSAVLRHLSPLTSYELRAVSGEDYGAVLPFTTGGNVQMPNEDFEQWWLDGKVWCPWAQGGQPYWGTGNKGATTLGDSNTQPTDYTVTGSGLAAKLETRFVGIGIVGKLAAGNIFVGSYVRTDGTNGVLSFGREFSQRPVKVRGYIDYKNVPMSHSNSEYKNLIGQPDTCIVWCALIDQDTPFEIRTNPNNRQLFDENGPYVVAYGKYQLGESTGGYIPIEFDLNYKSTDRVPKYILCTCSASKYGDFFTGGSGSVLYVDDLELIYDY